MNDKNELNYITIKIERKVRITYTKTDILKTVRQVLKGYI